ncbi:MAG: hypothetical protein C0623_08835 [Desulfuromonas sp.]|nr:MAG: hypothetical protein C0623_08835 [Desulfuromonas sp.]
MKIVFPTLHVRKSHQATPLAAASLAAMLHNRRNFECILLDFFPSDPPERMIRAILKSKPDLVVMPLYTWNRSIMLGVSQTIKQQAPSLPVIAGGPEVTADPHGVIREGKLDAAIRGEGEATFVELVDQLAEKKTIGLIPGLSRPQGHEIVDGPDRAPSDPESLQSPWLTGTLTPQAGSGLLWEVARGCRFDCSYCFDSRGSKTVEKLPYARLAAELELFHKVGVARIWVLDSTFNFPPERGKELLQLLAGTVPDIHFHLEAKADYLDEEMIQMLALLPCSIQIGLQSFHPQVLRAIHRAINIDLCLERLQILSEAGVTFGVDLIYGLPTDDLSGFRSSLESALSLQPNQVDIFPLSVLPGTPLYQHKNDFDLLAASTPPYEISSSETWTPDMLEKATLLAAATNLFYNLGRSVGFFSAILDITGKEPVPFLEGFADWMLLHQGIYRSVLTDIESWLPEEILPMQEGYVQFLLMRNRREALFPAALDLIRYHFHYAETLLEHELLPPAEELASSDCWHQIWVRSPHLRLVPFTYEIVDLLEMEEIDLEEFSELFRPVGSTALFYRRGDDVFCESLEEDFLTLLENCDGARTPEEIFSGAVSQKAGEEIVSFAVAEGLLLPVD